MPGNAISGQSHIFVAAWRSLHTCMISPADDAFLQHRPAGIKPEKR
jgi:hypothetical protein